MNRKITVVIEMEYSGESQLFPVGTIEHLRRYCDNGVGEMVEGIADFYQVLPGDLRATVTVATVRDATFRDGGPLP